jgi:pimeloyl-ACP methyl ester carboxylesterase
VNAHDDYARGAACTLLNPDGEWLLLLLHGLGGDRQQALGLIAGLHDAQLAVLAPDLRAHGDTQLVGGAEAFTFDALAADIVALVARLGQGGKPTIVAGISMGAALALRLALGGDLDVRGVALVRPAFDDTSNPANLAVMPLVAKLLRSSDPAGSRQALLDAPEYRAIAEVTSLGAASVEDQLSKPLARARAIRLAEVPKNVAWRTDGELRQLDLPVLVVGTDRDVMHPIEVARRTAALLPRAGFVEVVPRDVDPERYDRKIRSAVQRHIADVVAASS